MSNFTMPGLPDGYFWRLEKGCYDPAYMMDSPVLEINLCKNDSSVPMTTVEPLYTNVIGADDLSEELALERANILKDALLEELRRDSAVREFTGIYFIQDGDQLATGG